MGLSALLGLTNQGDARAFKAWTGHRTGSTFLCVCSELKTINICHRGWRRNESIVSMTDLERTKENLQEEFERMPHTQYDLLGNAACNRKIRALIMAYISDGATLSTCGDEIKSLMIESGVSVDNFEKEIMPEITVYYKAKELIDNGYFTDYKE